MALLRNTIIYVSFSRLTEVTDNVLSDASLTVANIHGYACNLPAVPNDATISMPTYALPPELEKCLVALTQLSKLLHYFYLCHKCHPGYVKMVLFRRMFTIKKFILKKSDKIYSERNMITPG